MVAVVGHGESLRKALGLVVDAADAHGVDVAQVPRVLGVHQRVAVDLARRGEHKAGTLSKGETRGVVGPQGARLEDRDRDAREVYGAGGGGEVVDLVQSRGNVYVGGDVVLAGPEGRLAS